MFNSWSHSADDQQTIIWIDLSVDCQTSPRHTFLRNSDILRRKSEPKVILTKATDVAERNVSNKQERLDLDLIILIMTNKPADQLSSVDSSFNLPIIAGYLTCLASFSTSRVWLCLLFTISCSSACQALKTIYYFLTQKTNSNST